MSLLLASRLVSDTPIPNSESQLTRGATTILQASDVAIARQNASLAARAAVPVSRPSSAGAGAARRDEAKGS